MKLRVSGIMTNAPIVLVQDCDMYSNDPETPLRALCYFLDPKVDPKLAFVQFPQRYHSINKNDIYANEFKAETQILSLGMDGLVGAQYMGTGGFLNRHVISDSLSISVTTSNVRVNASSIKSKELLISAYKVASCDFEENTSWGSETKLEDNILEKFKIIVRGKIFVIRAKELFVWSPTFNYNKEVDDYFEDDSVNDAEEINGDISKQMNLDDESDIEGVSDTVFDDKADSLGHEHTQNLSPNEKENSSNPFNLYNLLNKRDKGEANSCMENTLTKRRSEGPSYSHFGDAQPLKAHVFSQYLIQKKAGGIDMGERSYLRCHNMPLKSITSNAFAMELHIVPYPAVWDGMNGYGRFIILKLDAWRIVGFSVQCARCY
ncbi:cellulose synthase-like protein G3 [Tanacetum coccineum]